MSSPSRSICTHLVVNTSPLIHLSQAGLLSLLREAAPLVWVPEPVATEIQAYGKRDPTAVALAANSWLKVMPVGKVDEDILAWNLGAGESSVLILARGAPGSTAVIDDLAARRCAEALRLPLRGTVGLVLDAKICGRLEKARPVLEQLRSAGMYLSTATLNAALRLVGE